MTFANLKKLARGFLPGMKSKTMKNNILELIINQAVDDINAYVGALNTNKKFNVTAESGEIILSTAIGDYLRPDKPGLFWNDGSNWRRLYPRTRKYLDRRYPYWRDDSSGDPLRYFIENNILTLHPAPDTTLSEGLWLHYIQKATPMTNDEHYPFSGSAVEYAHLSIFDDAILEYAEWKITSKILNKKAQALVLKKDYKEEREEKMRLLGQRPDISHARRKTRYGGRAIC